MQHFYTFQINAIGHVSIIHSSGVVHVCNNVWHENFKFYGFTVAGRGIKLNVNFYYYIAKILKLL